MTRAQTLLAASSAQASADSTGVAREVGVPLMQGLMAFANGDADTACATLYPLRSVAHHFGGSHAQRDLIDQTLLAAATSGGNRAGGRALLNERRLAKPVTPLTQHWQRRLGSH
jgi:hypothetical protein